MARYENNGIFDTYIPETLPELFHHGNFGGNSNFAAVIASCAARAWDVFYTSANQTREGRQESLEQICARDLRNSAIARDARDLLVAEDILDRTLRLYERDLKRLVSRNTIERRARGLQHLTLRFGTVVSFAMKIVEIDSRIAVRPFEPNALLGKKYRDAKRESDSAKALKHEERDRLFLKFYAASKGQSRVENALKTITRHYQQFNKGCEDERDKVKTPSKSTAYRLVNRQHPFPRKTPK